MTSKIVNNKIVYEEPLNKEPGGFSKVTVNPVKDVAEAFIILLDIAARVRANQQRLHENTLKEDTLPVEGRAGRLPRSSKK